MNKKLILASASERRQKLLHLITDDFDILSADIDESSDISDPQKLVCSLAECKAQAVLNIVNDAVVIGADTVVWSQGVILGKPNGIKEAERFIRMLEGRRHYVYTGVCILSSEHKLVRSCASEVEFVHMSDAEIASYLDSGDYRGKAGAYGIQGEAAKYIKAINGCYYNVVGLPVSLVYEMLKSINQL